MFIRGKFLYPLIFLGFGSGSLLAINTNFIKVKIFNLTDSNNKHSLKEKLFNDEKSLYKNNEIINESDIFEDDSELNDDFNDDSDIVKLISPPPRLPFLSERKKKKKRKEYQDDTFSKYKVKHEDLTDDYRLEKQPFIKVPNFKYL